MRELLAWTIAWSKRQTELDAATGDLTYFLSPEKKGALCVARWVRDPASADEFARASAASAQGAQAEAPEVAGDAPEAAAVEVLTALLRDWRSVPFAQSVRSEAGVAESAGATLAPAPHQMAQPQPIPRVVEEAPHVVEEAPHVVEEAVIKEAPRVVEVTKEAPRVMKKRRRSSEEPLLDWEKDAMLPPQVGRASRPPARRPVQSASRVMPRTACRETQELSPFASNPFSSALSRRSVPRVCCRVVSSPARRVLASAPRPTPRLADRAPHLPRTSRTPHNSRLHRRSTRSSGRARRRLGG